MQILSPRQWMAMAAQNQADAMSGDNMSGNVMPWYTPPQSVAQQAGFRGQYIMPGTIDPQSTNDSQGSDTVSPEVMDWLESQGYRIGVANGQAQLLDASGAPIGDSWSAGNGDDRAFWNAALLAGGLIGSQFGNFGGGQASGGGAMSPITSSMPSAVAPDLAALGTAGTGSGVAIGGGSGAGLAAGGGGVAGLGGAAGSGMVAPAGTWGGAMGGGTGAGIGAGTGAATGAASSWIPGVSNNTVLGIGANLLSGYLGQRASGKAADAQLASGREANDLMRYMYETSRTDNAPFRQAGLTALQGIQNLLANPNAIREQPDYQFGFDQGTKALANSAASRGMTYSGAQAKALQRFGQDYAGSKLNESYNRLASIAGIGQQATRDNNAAGQSYAANAGQNITGMGNARAGAYIGGANSWSNAIGNALNAYTQDQWMRKLYGD